MSKTSPAKEPLCFFALHGVQVNIGKRYAPAGDKLFFKGGFSIYLVEIIGKMFNSTSAVFNAIRSTVDLVGRGYVPEDNAISDWEVLGL